MSKFLVLYHAPMSAREQMANATPKEAKAGMDAWMTWAGTAGSAIADLGSPLGDGESIGSGKSEDEIAGYSMLEAGSQADAVAVLDGHPHLEMPGAWIEVRELLSGM